MKYGKIQHAKDEQYQSLINYNEFPDLSNAGFLFLDFCTFLEASFVYFPSIFTVELENNMHLPFLDIIIISNGNHLEFYIFAKPTHTSKNIRIDSNLCNQQKSASVSFLIQGLLKFPLSKTRYNKEFKRIEEIAGDNGYSPAVANKMINKFKFRLLFTRSSTITGKTFETKFFSMAFYSPYTRILESIFRKLGHTVAFRLNNYPLQTYLGNVEIKFQH